MMGTGPATKAIISAIIWSVFLMMVGIPFPIAIIAVIIWKGVGEVRAGVKMNERKKVANIVPPCPGCGQTNWVPKSRAEFVWRHMDLWVRQHFDCVDFDIRCRLVRSTQSETWWFPEAYFV